MLIVYSSPNEVIVVTPNEEKLMLLDYFTAGGRNIDDYDRVKHGNTVEIQAVLRCDWGKVIPAHRSLLPGGREVVITHDTTGDTYNDD